MRVLDEDVVGLVVGVVQWSCIEGVFGSEEEAPLVLVRVGHEQKAAADGADEVERTTSVLGIRGRCTEVADE